MPKKRFKKKALASSIALAVTSGLYVQSSIAQETEEVIVTGIRGSLIRSLDVKRNATGVVDAISAEDIGKFPDTNLAESLQRITGVSINRDNGEGQQITVRGFGPDSNIVTLNGRHMPAARVNTGGPSNTRAFNFSDLAAEGVSGVQVYKTGRASIASGGVGATINISTLKPLDRPGFNFTAGVKAVHDTTNREGDDVTPEISTLISHTTDDERFGISFVGSYQERDSSTNGIDHNDWRTQAYDPNDALFRNATVVNAPDVGQLWSQPRNLVYQLDDIERKRTNGQLTLQFRPVENFTATLDYTYSEQESTTERLEQSIWFEPTKGTTSGVSRIEFDDNTVATPILYSERFSAADGFSDLTFGKILLSTLNENESIGLNLDWDVSDNLNLRFDYHDSTAEAGPVNSTLGTRSRFSAAVFGVAEQEVNFGQSRPGSRVVIDDSTPPGGVGAAPDPRGIVNGSFGVEDLSSTRGEAVFTDTVTDIEQLQIAGSFEFDDGSIDFGIDRREMVNRTRSTNIQPVFGDWGGAAPEIVPDEFFTPINVPGELGVDGFTNGFNYDFQTLADWAAGVNASGTQGSNFRDFNNGIFSTDREFETDRQIEEDITALFVQLNLQGELGGLPTSTVFGIRYEQTDVTATSLFQQPIAVRQEDDDDFMVVLAPDLSNISGEGEYSNLLPSLDFDISLTDDLKARMSFSETIGRPLYDELRAGVGGFNFNAGSNPSAISGNPNLEPLESQNLDLSFEWYYSDSSYASVGYYRKEVDNFVATNPILLPQFGLTDPTSGARANQAIADLAAAGNANPGAIDIFNQMLTNAGLDPNDQSTFIDGDAAQGDPLVQWLTATPTNARTAQVFGFELAVQHLFGESGFGVIANYTTVSGNVNYDVELDPTGPNAIQFVLLGLSDTANLVGFYEKDGLQVRLSYNWRDEFLNNTAEGGQREPSFSEAFGQVDLNISYDINDNFNVFLEGININEEDSRSHGRYRAQLNQYNELGARYQLGARYNF